MKKGIFFSVTLTALIYLGGCSKSDAADAVVGKWAGVVSHYTVTSGSSCIQSKSYAYPSDTFTATVTKVSANVVTVTTTGSGSNPSTGSRTVQLNGSTLDEIAYNANVNYYGSYTDTLEWTLSGNTLNGKIKGQSCATLTVVATKQ